MCIEEVVCENGVSKQKFHGIYCWFIPNSEGSKETFSDEYKYLLEDLKIFLIEELGNKEMMK